MEEEQYRSVILFLFLDEKTCGEMKAKLDPVYGDLLPSMTTVNLVQRIKNYRYVR